MSEHYCEWPIPATATGANAVCPHCGMVYSKSCPACQNRKLMFGEPPCPVCGLPDGRHLKDCPHRGRAAN